MLIAERELTVERLAAELGRLCAGRGKLLAMAERAPARAPARGRGTCAVVFDACEERGMTHSRDERMRRINTIHFVGIGGSGMGGIAEVLMNLGYRVQGSDLKASAVTQRLSRARRAHRHRSCEREH